MKHKWNMLWLYVSPEPVIGSSGFCYFVRMNTRMEHVIDMIPLTYTQKNILLYIEYKSVLFVVLHEAIFLFLSLVTLSLAAI